MSTRGWENFKPSDLVKSSAPKSSKYRNVKMTVDGETFDSRREADYWMVLKAREKMGEISDLKRQVRFPLFAPVLGQKPLECVLNAVVAHYVADYTYRDPRRGLHIVDAKGHRTALFKLKAKWLALQEGVTIEEV